MLYKKGKSAIGIELVGDRINVVKLKKTPKGIALIERHSISLPITNEAKEKFSFPDYLGSLLKNWNARRDVVIVGIGGHFGFVRRVKLPPVSQSKLERIISFEVQQQVPFPLNEVIWDYYRSSAPTKTLTPVPVEIMIVAIKQAVVEDLLKNLEEVLKRDPDVVDISSLALHNCLFFNGLLNNNQLGIVIHSAFNHTDILIESMGKLVFARAVPIGRRNLLDAISNLRNVDMEEAREILRSGEDVSRILEPVWQNLLTEVKRTTNYYFSQMEQDRRFEYVYLAGDCSKDKYFSSLLKDAFQVEARSFNPLEKIIYEPTQLKNGDENLGVSIGLGLGGLIDSLPQVNLLPLQILKKMEANKKKPYFLTSFLAIILIGLFLFVFGIQDYAIIQAKIDHINPILKTYEPNVPKMSELRRERTEILGKLKTIENRFSERRQWSIVFLELSRLTPAHTYITNITNIGGRREIVRADVGRPPRPPGEMMWEMEMDMEMMWEMEMGEREAFLPPGEVVPAKNVVFVRGITTSYLTLEEYLEELKTSPLFKSIELISMDHIEEKIGFTLNITLKD